MRPTSTKEINKKPYEGRLGWCLGLDADHTTCPVEVTASVESANCNVGDTYKCNCDCHSK